MTSLLLLQYQVDCVASDDNKVSPFVRLSIPHSHDFSFGQCEQQGCICVVIDTGIRIAHDLHSIANIRYLQACSNG